MEKLSPPGDRSLDASYFDQWYADMESSPDRDAIVTRALGPARRSSSSTSLLTWAGIAEVTEALRLPPGGLLVDAACGRGGYGIEIARRTGARLLGVDFSAVALEQARRSSARRLPAAGPQFQAGTLTATGLADGRRGRAHVRGRGPVRRAAAGRAGRVPPRAGTRRPAGATCWEAAATGAHAPRSGR